MNDATAPSGGGTGARLEGGCLCGSVRYTVPATPASVSICNCRHCRKQSGAQRSVNWLLLAGEMEISGEVATYEDRGDSGMVVRRQFCPRCGSPIRTVMESVPGHEFLKVGGLDVTPENAPMFAIYGSRAAAWEAEPLTCPQFPLNR